MLLFFWVSWLTTIAVALMPIAFFLAFGWSAREAEFLNKVRVDDSGLGCGEKSGHEMQTYFDKFWSKGQAEYRERHPDIAGLLDDPPRPPATFWECRQPATPLDAAAVAAYRIFAYRTMFRARYRELIGRGRYLWPLLLLTVVVSTLAGLVVVTELRIGYEQFIGYFTGEARLDDAAVKAGVTIVPRLTIKRVELAQLDQAVLPFPPVHLSPVSLAGIAGAYLFVLTQLIQQSRARTLVYSDLFSASLRLLISVPLGISVSSVAPTSAAGPFVSFALGAFPIRELGAILRRMLGRLLQFDTRAEEDGTLAMLGVTRSVSDVLAEENITCAQQLADIDPVVLAVRTGLSFDYVLFLAAQSLVWCFLGRTAGLLGPLGYGDARAIWFLTRQPPDTQVAVLKSLCAGVAATSPQLVTTPQALAGSGGSGASVPAVWTDPRLLFQAFSKIALDPYTLFLVRFTSDMESDGMAQAGLKSTTTGSATSNCAIALAPG